jgi:hypothetical protein
LPNERISALEVLFGFEKLGKISSVTDPVPKGSSKLIMRLDPVPKRCKISQKDEGNDARRVSRQIT